MKILDIAFKDLTRSFRSAFAVGMMFIAPLLTTGLIYFAFGNPGGGGGFTITPVKVVVVNLDQTTPDGLNLGALIVDALRNPEFDRWFSLSTADTEAAGRQQVNRREAGVAVIIPADFSHQAVATDGQSRIVLVQDPTLTIGPSIIRDVISQIVDSVAGTKLAVAAVADRLQAAGQPVTPDVIQSIILAYSQWSITLAQSLDQGALPAVQVRAPQDNPAATTSSGLGAVLLAGVMSGQMIFFAFYTGAYGAQSILREDEEGTLPRLFATPTARTSILGGKFLGVFVLSLVQAVVLMAASALAFGINWGAPLPAALSTLATIGVAAGFGIFLMSFVKTTRQSGMVLGGALTAFGMLGGLFTVAVPMPDAFAALNLLTPQGWVLRAWSTTLHGGTLLDVLPLALIIMALGAAFFALGVRRFRRRYA